ncbi:MAG: family N-acetyltransferase [Eubacterium sp.]|jgi:RimJ/RimL family protein N-acetyltransferase|nr:family N-acetyltransferase [Eubacterium sp.]
MEFVKIVPEMAEDFLKLLKTLDCESKFMMLEPFERTITAEQLAERLDSDDQNGIYFGARVNSELIGFISASRGNYKRIRHGAYIVIGILKNYSGQGIGKSLFEKIDEWSLLNSITRLELTVMTHNFRAIRLYEKMGFVREGIKYRSMVVDGQYVDEYYMAKLI